MRRKYTETDPSIIKLKNLKLDYEIELKKQLLAFLDARKRGSKSTIESYYRSGEVISSFKELIREAIKVEKFLDQFETEKKTLLVQSSISNKNWDLITKPTLNPNPVAPYRKKIALTGLLTGLIFGVMFAIFFEKKKGILFEIDELNKLINIDLIGTFSEKEKNEWDESLSLLSENILLKTNNKSITLLEVGNLNKELVDNFKKYLEKAFGIKNMPKTNDFLEAKKFDYQIIIISLGEIRKKELRKLQTKLNLQSTQTLGMINLVD